MKIVTILTVILISALGVFSQSKTFLQTIAGNWEGILEYSDYSNGKRVKLKTCLTVTPSADGSSAEVLTIYDDFGRIIKNNKQIRIDLSGKNYFDGDYQYKIESAETEKMVLSGSGQDGEKVEPLRITITFDKNSLVFLKETRTPWQFRNQLSLKRTTGCSVEK